MVHGLVGRIMKHMMTRESQKNCDDNRSGRVEMINFTLECKRIGDFLCTRPEDQNRSRIGTIVMREIKVGLI
jgi:hypothetical protein